MAAGRYICSQIDMPICKTLSVEQTVYNQFKTSFLDFDINSPYTLTLLIISIFCSNRMIEHVDSLYSSIGRGEMKTFFYLYIASNLALIFTLCFQDLFDKTYFDLLNAIQISIQSTCFFCLFVGGMTIDKIYGIMGMKSANFLRILSAVYFILIFAFTKLFVVLKNPEIITIMISIETGLIILYLLSQIRSLKRNNGEIWGYGVLSVIFLFFVMSKIHTLLGAKIVAALSERNVDNMFFNVCYTFLVVMMCHKFWLSTYDFELECLALPA